MSTATELKKLPTSPPAPTAMAVKAHKQALIMALNALQAAGPALAMASAKGDLAARAELPGLYLKIAAVEFEISLNDQAVERARSVDQASAEAWRSAEQTMEIEEILSGLSKGGCPSRCTKGVHCAITAAAPHAGGTCGHPVLTRDQQFRDEFGRWHFRYESTPRALKIYQEACRRLKVSPS